MIKRRVYILIITVLILMVVGIVVHTQMQNLITSKEGSVVSEAQLLKDLKALLHIEKLRASNSNINVIENGSKKYSTLDVEFQDDEGIVDKSKKVIYAACINGPFSSASKPFEIRFLARTFLYCRSRILPYDIIGYRISYRSAFMYIFSPTNYFKISNSELERIYLDYGIDRVKGEKQIDEFAKAIIKEINYRRAWSPNEDYLKGIN